MSGGHDARRLFISVAWRARRRLGVGSSVVLPSTDRKGDVAAGVGLRVRRRETSRQSRDVAAMVIKFAD